jgi:peptidoglycan/xylan/chitin deacetylase (PgdA/CDA1 family)
MRAQGFEIGSHTRSHVDLGTISGDIAIEEIAMSRKDLETKLEVPVCSFAYPYGYNKSISEENRAIVRTSGYRCCCGYGYINTTGTDPYRLGRIPISSWYISPYHFAGDLLIYMLTKKKAF